MIAYMEKNENCKENRFLSMDSLKKNSRFYLVAAFLAAAIREFDTSKLKRILQSLETGLFFCQIFVFII